MIINQVKKQSGPIVFNMTSSQCVWASAGVIGPTACINAFNCLSCPVDAKMQARVKNQQLGLGPVARLPVQLKEKNKRTLPERKCRHMLSGRVPSKYCVHDFDCATCSYHQMMDDDSINLSCSPVAFDYAGGFLLAENYYYHRGHAWARVEYGGRIRVGLDDFSMRLTGPLDSITLPTLGSMIRQGEPDIGLTREAFKAEALSPIEGIVVALNPNITANPSLANIDPYGEGWLMVIEPTKLKANLRKLLFLEESLAWIEDESSRLSSLLTEETAYKLAATGGRVVNDIFGNSHGISWHELIKAFLLTG